MRCSQFLVGPMAIGFGRPSRAAVVASGVLFGTVEFEHFGRDLQSVLDSVDPVNYAATAPVASPSRRLSQLTAAHGYE